MCQVTHKACPHGRTTYCKYGCFPEKGPVFLVCDLCGRQLVPSFKTVTYMCCGMKMTPDGTPDKKVKKSIPLSKPLPMPSCVETNSDPVQEIPASSNYARQWNVKGSRPAPYVVSLGGIGDWRCSCFAWTQNIPREDCKHVLRVKLKLVSGEGKIETVPSLPVPKKTVGRRFR
jgi:hypothetical protein